MSSIIGKEVVLINMKDDPQPIPAGTKGTIEMIDDVNHVHVKWDNGRNLSLIPGVDSWIYIDNRVGRTDTLSESDPSKHYVMEGTDIVSHDFSSIEVRMMAERMKESSGTTRSGGESTTCPRCNENKLHPDEAMNALSRSDNETYICNDCGVDEAMEELKKYSREDE